MNILITGSNGFIGKNFKYYLKTKKKIKVLEYKRNNPKTLLLKKLNKADVILHFAGENRSDKKENFFKNNFGLSKLISENAKSNSLIIFSSTTKISEKTDYGISKLNAEKILKNNKKKNNYNLVILRLTNVFGKWSKPNYNSVVATFCYNAGRNIKSNIFQPNAKLKLLYIDDLINQVMSIIENRKYEMYPKIKKINSIKLKSLYDKIYSFNEQRINLKTDVVKNSLDKKIYSTYLTFVPVNKFVINYKKNEDKRGNFSELLRSNNNGQVSYFSINPGETRGDHFHFTKVERFFPVSGKGTIIYKNIQNHKVKKYNFNSKKPEIYETIPGWSHKLVNKEKTEAIFVLWTNEIFDKKNPDTYYYDQ